MMVRINTITPERDKNSPRQLLRRIAVSRMAAISTSNIIAGVMGLAYLSA